MAFPNGWTRSCPMVIQHAQVTGSLTDYPVAINHASFIANCPEILTTGDANAAQADGGDIRFSSDVGGCVQLACEIVDWTQNATPSLATAEIHVGGTAPDSAGDVTIYPWWKAGGGKTQPGVTDPFGVRAVWTPSSHEVVLHFGSPSSFPGLDSLSESVIPGYPGYSVCIPSGGASTGAGKFGGGINFASSSQYAFVPSHRFMEGISQFTLSVWLKLTSYGSQGMCAFSVYQDTGNDNIMLLGLAWGVGVQVDNGTDGGGSYALDPRGVWHHLVLVFDGSLAGNANRLKLYDQGVLRSLTFDGGYTAPATASSIASTAKLNNYIDLTWGGVAIEDEYRASGVARSADWIATEYANQNSPGAFIIAGTPYTVSSWHCGGADPWFQVFY